MTMRRYAFFLAIFAFALFCSAGFAEEQNPGAIFKSAASFYEKGEYDKAIKEYGKLAERGLESGNLYYNIGNCYFKKGKLGMAILNYERAKRLMPRDSDLASNYEYARSLVKGQSGIRAPFYKRMMNRFAGQFTLNGLTVFLSGVYILIVSALIASIFFASLRRYLVVLILPLLIIAVASAVCLTDKIRFLDKSAVVISDKTDARFAPFRSATTYFTLYEGMEAEVIAGKEEWRKIRRADGKTGWVKSEDLAPVSKWILP